MEIENNTPFTMADVKTKIFYVQSRGINKTMAERMMSKEMKDAVLFRPGLGVLQMFCRPHEIFDKEKRELLFGEDPEIPHRPPLLNLNQF